MLCMFVFATLLLVSCAKQESKPEHVGLSHARLTVHNRRIVEGGTEFDIYYLFPIQFKAVQEFFMRERIHPVEGIYLHRVGFDIYLRLDAPRAQEILNIVVPLDTRGVR